jgi:cell division transport system permease protein
MIFTKIKRVLKGGFVNFWRNGFLSLAAIVVITLCLGAFGTLIFGSVFGRAFLTEVKSRVDINVYFALDAEETDIIELKGSVEKLSEVASAEYISRDQALENFKEKWKDNALILQGLEEIGENPLPAVLNIKAKEPSQYAGIAKFLDSKSATAKDGSIIIEKVNYNQNKIIIDRLGRIIPLIESTGAIVAGLLVIVAIIIVFNTIRLIIYTAKEEISVMRLVGASNMYIRGPFVVSGIMYGVISGLITLIIIAVIAYWSDSAITKFAGIEGARDFSLIINIFSSYFVKNFGQIFAIIMGSGIVLGAVSSYLAVKRYLNV